MSFTRQAKAYLRIIESYKRRRTRLSYFPPLLWVEPTNGCNLKCAMCPNSVIDKGKAGYMEPATLRRIVDEAVSHYPGGEATIALFLGGEPLLHRDLFEMVAYATSRNVNVNLATNATLLSDGNIDALLSTPPTLLIVSFDGYDKESYEKARAGANFEKTLRNVLRLLDERKRRGLVQPLVRMYSLILRTDREREEREKFAKFYGETFRGKLVDEILVQNAGDWVGMFEGRESEVFVPSRQEGANFLPCARLWYSMSVLWDGRVVPCCADFTGKMVLGDVGKKSLSEIWNDEPYVSLREKMVRRDISSLRLCSEGCDVPYPSAGVLWGIPGELLIHRKILRDIKSRIFAKNVGPG